MTPELKDVFVRVMEGSALVALVSFIILIKEIVLMPENNVLDFTPEQLGMSSELSRKKFEQWAFDQTELEEGNEISGETGCYFDDQMELAWRSWQAAIASERKRGKVTNVQTNKFLN